VIGNGVVVSLCAFRSMLNLFIDCSCNKQISMVINVVKNGIALQFAVANKYKKCKQ